jgi:hypothetical protein
MAAPISKRAVTHGPLRALSPARATQPTASVLRKGRTVQTSGKSPRMPGLRVSPRSARRPIMISPGRNRRPVGNRRGGAPRSLIAVHGGQFLRFLIITRKHDDKFTAIRSGARDHHGPFSQISTSTPPALSIASRRTQPEHVTMFNRISRFSGDRSNNVLHKRRGRGQPATGHDRTTIRLSDEIEAKIGAWAERQEAYALRSDTAPR